MQRALSYSRFPFFWRLQLLYWSAFGAMSALSLLLWGDVLTFQHIAVILFQSALAAGLSFPLHLIFTLIWPLHINTRVVLSILSVAIVASFWTIIRGIFVFYSIAEDADWMSVGAWYFGMFYAYLGWAAFYHGIQYYFLLEGEHGRALEAETAASEEQVKRLQAETKAKDAKLKMLRYQLNPHFLFNTLNAITSLIRIEANRRAQEITIKLSHFLRYTLDNNPDMKIPLKQEMEVLGMYLDIEKTRFQERLNLDIRLEENSKNALLPSLLLQPLIENSMKYAIAKNENGGTISIVSRVIGTTLQISLSDTGAAEVVRPSKIATPQGRGIGLRNTVDRLKAFYNDLYEFDLQPNEQGGLTTTITIPYETRG